MRAPKAARWAGVKVRRLRFASVGAEFAGVAAGAALFGGLPRRFVGPWRASMARLILSRSLIRRATICSVGIERIVSQRVPESALDGLRE
jgi:hypothetical protein